MSEVYLVHESKKKYGPFKTMSTMIENVGIIVDNKHNPLHRTVAELLGFKLEELGEESQGE